jgi:hypothetical protein
MVIFTLGLVVVKAPANFSASGWTVVEPDSVILPESSAWVLAGGVAVVVAGVVSVVVAGVVEVAGLVVVAAVVVAGVVAAVEVVVTGLVVAGVVAGVELLVVPQPVNRTLNIRMLISNTSQTGFFWIFIISCPPYFLLQLSFHY